MFKRFITLVAAATLTGASLMAEGFIPTVHGTFRADYELSTDNGESRFQVQNARITATGAPLEFLDYFLQVDFCAAGKVKPLDVFITLHPDSHWKIFAGQMRVPFSAESTRLPRDYYFVNTAMVQNYGNLRAVGVKVGYNFPGTPLYTEGGVFNSSDMEAHTAWNDGMTYGIRLNATTHGWHPEVAFMSRIPGGTGAGVRVNMANASLAWTSAHWFVEGEYIYRTYTGNSHPATHVYSIYADYSHHMSSRMFNRWSVQARFDGQTDGATGIYNAEHEVVTNVPSRRRVTVGATVSHRSSVRLDFRVNYEQYFYGHTSLSHPDPSRLLAGVMFYF